MDVLFDILSPQSRESAATAGDFIASATAPNSRRPSGWRRRPPGRGRRGPARRSSPGSQRGAVTAPAHKAAGGALRGDDSRGSRHPFPVLQGPWLLQCWVLGGWGESVSWWVEVCGGVTLSLVGLATARSFTSFGSEGKWKRQPPPQSATQRSSSIRVIRLNDRMGMGWGGWGVGGDLREEQRTAGQNAERGGGRVPQFTPNRQPVGFLVPLKAEPSLPHPTPSFCIAVLQSIARGNERTNRT